MRRSFVAGLLAAAVVLPGPAFAQREDLTVVEGQHPGRQVAPQQDGERRGGPGGWNGQRGDGGGGFRQRGEGFGQRQFQQPQQLPQQQFQQPQVPPAPQAVPVQPSPPTAQFQQRGFRQDGFRDRQQFRQDGFQNRQQFRQDGFQNRQQFRQDRGVNGGQAFVPPAPVINDPRRFNGQDGRGFRNRPGGDQFRDYNRYGGTGFTSNRYGGTTYRGNNGYYNDRGFGNRGGWDRGWRNNNRYDWQGYRAYNRGFFQLPRYYAPQGWGYGYRRFGIGLTLNSILFDQDYWIDDPEYFRLPPAYGPYQWVRYYNDALLVDVRSGYVVDAVYDIFY